MSVVIAVRLAISRSRICKLIEHNKPLKSTALNKPKNKKSVTARADRAVI